MRLTFFLKLKLVFIIRVMFTLIIFCYSSVKAQDVNVLNINGANVQFVYTTFKQFQNGVTLEGWTKIKLQFRKAGSTGWELRVYSTQEKIEYEGAVVNNINLNELTITPTVNSSTNIVASVNAGFALNYNDEPPAATSVLVSATGTSTDVATADISISYTLGPMLNKPEGFYYVPLRFVLVEK